MILLDTNHISILMVGRGTQFTTLSTRMAASFEAFATTVISVEEITRGWMAHVKRARNTRGQVPSYDRLIESSRFFGGWYLARFSETAADIFDDLRKQKVRIGTMDLKIAAIALAENATLLSANLSDFQQVPGLRVEDWLR